MARQLRPSPPLAGLLLLCILAGCTRQPAAPQHPVILIGVDGAEWNVIRELWSQGQLPALRRIAEQGVAASLDTDYAISPVIWTSIATGRPPKVHGITGFVVPSPKGDVPVSSTLRRVPALWNMAAKAGHRTAVVSWWASWPVEAIPGGVVVSDRAMNELPHGISPPAFAARFAALREAALAGENGFGGNPETARRDRVTAEVGRALAAERYDLLMVYFRGVDLASHLTWRYFHPQGFPPLPAERLASQAGEIPRVYRATDEAIGRIAAAAPQANLFVISDHGFRRMRDEEVLVTLDFDRVLHRLGYLERLSGEAGIDWSRTRLSTWGSPPTVMLKKLRIALAGRDRAGRVRAAEVPALRAALERDLARVTWNDGRAAFRLRDPRPREKSQGADLVAAMLVSPDSRELRVDGEPWLGAVEISRISGSHNEHTDGVFLATGPDLVRAAADSEVVRGIGIRDVAPTILYALGLPVGEDFDGRARTDLFTAAFQRRHPLRTVKTWGKPRQGIVTPSAADEELVRELEALGYLR
jgi:predicted AlkP superfamily phosphohydrolase/phosphomutase